MVKVIFLAVVVLISCSLVTGLSPAGCPPSSKMISCSPKCKDDSECFGQKCCPDICNSRSCTAANQLSNTKDGYKNQNAKSATGSYCGNVKCNSFERCGLDPSTKRQKCIRH